ncbi:MAG: MMPL family transporter [Acidobacteria bacterium]|nr:MMPL family transporter [Acidobacteriota bacterium]
MYDLFFRNRRLLQLVLALIVVGGVSSYSVLPRTEDPRLTKRNALITTIFPGASAEQVESLVTEKLEERIEEIEEIKKLDSTSRAGVSALTVELYDEVSEADADQVWSRLRDKLGDVAPELPAGALAPEFNEADTEIDAYTLIVAFTWQDAPPNLERVYDVTRSGVGYPTMRRLAETLSDRLRAVPGTKQTKLFGAPEEEILVKVAPAKLADLGLTAADVSRRIAQSDSKAPAGQLRGKANDLLLEVEGELDSMDRVRNVPVVSGPDGRVVRVADLGRVEKSVADPPSQVALVNGKPAVIVAARMESEQRIDEWAARVRREVDDYQALTPRGIRLETLFDQSRYVEQRMDGLERNLLMAVALVMGVVWFTMGWRSALLIGAALPISALMALTGMRLIGLPIHQMSVTGLIVALGLLIDNAIVMVDEVRTRLDEGETAVDAVGRSVRHLAVPLLGSTLTSVFSFLPIVLLPGGGGEFVGPIAVSVIIALLTSLFAALTIIPALTGLFAEPRPAGAPHSTWRDGFSDSALTDRYRAVLRQAFARPVLAIAVTVAVPLVGFLLQPTLQEQFFPPADRDQFQIQLRLPQQASLDETVDYAARARELLIRHDQIDEVAWVVGGNAPKFYYNMLGGDEGSPFYAQALVSLRDNRDYFSLIRGIQTELDQALPGAQFIVLQLEQGPPFQAPIEIHLTGPDLETLRSLGDSLRAELTRTPGVTHTLTTLRDGRPKLHVAMDEEELRLAGLDNLSAAQQLQGALDGRTGGSLLEGVEELPVRVRLADAHRTSLAETASIDLISARGSVPLEAVGQVELRPELASITHKDGQRVNTIRGYTQSGLLPSVALHAFEARLAEAPIALPPGYSISYGGEAEQRNDAVGDLLANVSLLVILMASTLVLSFNSFRMAAVIGGVAVLSMGYAFLMLWVFQYPFGFVAIVGSMGLIGVAVNDSIVVLAALREDPDVALGDGEAAVDVVLRATRHVITTTATTAIGFTPLLINGGDFWPPLAISLGAGVIGATFLALFFVPASLLLVNRRAARRAAAAPHPAAA